MIRGTYTAHAALTTAALRLGVVSNNVANAHTPGYKQERLPEDVAKPMDLRRLAREGRDGEIGGITLGPRSGLAELDLSLGPLQETGNPLDLALGGSGFFGVRAATGEVRYTRDGGFRVDSDGALRARDGSALLNQAGQPIVLPPGSLEVSADGTLFVDGVQRGRVQIVDFGPGQQLRKMGNGMFAPEGEAAPQATADGTVQVYQGFLEGSNVDLTESMVATMELVRAYAANQRLLQLQDESLSRAVNDIGKV